MNRRDRRVSALLLAALVSGGVAGCSSAVPGAGSPTAMPDDTASATHTDQASTNAPTVEVVVTPTGFTETTTGAPEGFTPRLESYDGCVLATRTSTEPSDVSALQVAPRDASDAVMQDELAELDGSDAVVTDSWLAATGETDLDGDPVAVVNTLQADWTADDGGAFGLAVRAGAVADFSGAVNEPSVEVLLLCPVGADLDSTWERIVEQLRPDIWTPGPETAGQWPATSG